VLSVAGIDPSPLPKGEGKQRLAAEQSSARSQGRRAWTRFGPLLALAALVIVTSIFNPRFLTPANLLNILHAWSFVGLLAVGMTVVIISGGMDLSVGSLVALAGGVGVLTVNAAGNFGQSSTPQSLHEGPAVLAACAVTLAVGAAAGFVNGQLVTLGRVAPFVATLGGLAAFRSLALALADGGEFRSLSFNLFPRLGSGGLPLPFLTTQYGQTLALPWPVIVLALAAALVHLLLNWTPFGRYVYAIGCNERAAVYAGVPVARVKVAAYTLLGLLTGLAALLNASRMNSVSSAQTGLMWELDAIAAVVIGGTRMTGGTGSVWGTLIGLLLLGVIGNMLNLLQISPYLQGLVKGLIIVAAVLIQRGKREE
jgi:ribose transport system permease protein